MGLANYMSRNPSEPAKPPNEYDENFLIATTDIIRETLDIIGKRGRTRKQQNQQPTNVQPFHHKQKQYPVIARRFQTHYNKQYLQTTER